MQTPHCSDRTLQTRRKAQQSRKCTYACADTRENQEASEEIRSV